MEDIIYRWVDKFGFPVVLCFILLYVVKQIHGKWEAATNRVADLAKASNESLAHVAKIAEASNLVTEKNSIALDRNTASADNMSEVIERSLGSGNSPVCKSTGCQASELKPYLIEISDEMRRLAVGLSDAQVIDVVTFKKAELEKKKAAEKNSPGKHHG